MSTTRKAKKMKILLPVDASPYSEEAVQAVSERPKLAGRQRTGNGWAANSTPRNNYRQTGPVCDKTKFGGRIPA